MAGDNKLIFSRNELKTLNILGIVAYLINIFIFCVIAFAICSSLRFLSGRSLWKFLCSRRALLLVSNSLDIAFFSSLSALLPSFCLAMLIQGKNFELRNFLLKIVRIPFALPSIIIIVSLVTIFGVSGIFPSAHTFLYSKKGVILAHAYYSFSLLFSSLLSALEQRKPDREESFRTLGACKSLAFLLITFPAIAKTMLFSFLLSFFSAFFSFTIVMTFAGIKHSNIESEIYKAFSIGDNVSYSNLCFLSIVFTFIFVLLLNHIRKLQMKNDNSMFHLSADLSMMYKLFLNFMSLLVSFAVLYPLILVFSSAFRYKNELSLYNFVKLIGLKSVILKSIGLSFSVSITSVMMAILLCAYSKRTGFSNIMVFFAGAISGIVLSSSLSDNVGFSLFLAHIFMTIPFVYYMVKGEYDNIKSSVIEYETLTSKSVFLNVFYVEVSQIRHIVVNALFFSFVISFCDVSSTLLLSKGKFYTASIVLYQAVSRYDFPFASAIAISISLVAVIYYSIIKIAMKILYS